MCHLKKFQKPLVARDYLAASLSLTKSGYNPRTESDLSAASLSLTKSAYKPELDSDLSV